MGFLWVTGFSFFHCVASPFHSFVTIVRTVLPSTEVHLDLAEVSDRVSVVYVHKSPRVICVLYGSGEGMRRISPATPGKQNNGQPSRKQPQEAVQTKRNQTKLCDMCVVKDCCNIVRELAMVAVAIGRVIPETERGNTSHFETVDNVQHNVQNAAKYGLRDSSTRRGLQCYSCAACAR